MVCLIAGAALSEAKPRFLKALLNTYTVDPASALGQAKCAICHTNVPQRNAYGKDVKKLLDASSDGQVTAELLHQLDAVDSDGDGWSNGDEIKQGFLPGDPASHPSGTAPKVEKPNSSAVGTATGSKESSSIIPSNGFHPVVIHFPIALFLFAIVLEFFGIRRKEPALNTAALWNLSGAIISLAVVTPTGIAAWLIGQHKLEGTMLIHLLLAITSLLMMIGTLVARKKLGFESKAYWTILLIGAIVVGLTGHFGGQLVYG